MEERQRGVADSLFDRSQTPARLRISKLVERRSEGAVRFYVASLYPLLYRLETRGWIQGRWVEKSGQRRRRYYRLTRQGRKVLASQRRGWQVFVEAINRIT
jgi:DNA-binding PadR family transcriptional regulator